MPRYIRDYLKCQGCESTEFELVEVFFTEDFICKKVECSYCGRQVTDVDPINPDTRNYDDVFKFFKEFEFDFDEMCRIIEIKPTYAVMLWDIIHNDFGVDELEEKFDICCSDCASEFLDEAGEMMTELKDVVLGEEKN